MNIKPHELNKIQVAVLPKTHGPKHSSPTKPSNRLELFRLERGASASKSYEPSRAKETLSQFSKKSRKSTFPKSPLQIWHPSHWRKRKTHPDWQVVQLVEWRKMLRRHLCKGPSLRTSLRLSAATATRTMSRHYYSRMERMRSTEKRRVQKKKKQKKRKKWGTWRTRKGLAADKLDIWNPIYKGRKSEMTKVSTTSMENEVFRNNNWQRRSGIETTPKIKG